MRIFFVIVSFITAFLYFLVYALYDNILAVFGRLDVTGVFISFLKTFILVIVSFLIGFIVILLLKIKSEKKIKEAITKKVHGKQTMPKMIFENKIFN